ncbi:MFS transporter [Rhodococcus sp. NPDC127528]|uniref:MFS transporter n=1 Tax=unclassified Rhodococcus (in: high G+C Gram-positive bacteria) TaxID=192944 RepID=UPI003639F8D8
MSVATTPPEAPTGTRRSVPKSRTAWMIVGLLFLFTFMNFADKAVVGLAGVEMIKDLGLTKEQFGIVQSSFFWMYAVGAIVGGLLVGRIPARWLLAGTASLWVIALIPMIWSSSFTVLVATRVLLGFAEGPTAAMALAVAHSWFTADKRALPSSIITAGTSAGPLVAAPVITALVLHHSWHAAFAVTAAAGVCWVVLWLMLGKEGKEEAGDPHAGQASMTDSVLPEHVPYRRLLLSGTVVGTCVLFFVTYSNSAVKISWLPLYLREGLGYDATTAAKLITLPYLTTGIMMVLAGLASRMMTKRGLSNRVARGGFASGLIVVGGLSTIAFSMIDRGPLQIVLISVGASLVAASNGVAWAAVSDVVPAKQRGTVFACIIAAYSLGGIVAPLILGKLVDNAGESPLEGYSRGFLGLGIMLIVGAIIAFLLINPDKEVKRLAAKASRDNADVTA